eukprot:scaffold453_cov187-Ochromonas_danica.AAC.4
MEALSLASKSCSLLEETPFIDSVTLADLSQRFFLAVDGAHSKILSHASLIASVTTSEVEDFEAFVEEENKRLDALASSLPTASGATTTGERAVSQDDISGR